MVAQSPEPGACDKNARLKKIQIEQKNYNHNVNIYRYQKYINRGPKQGGSPGVRCALQRKTGIAGSPCGGPMRHLGTRGQVSKNT